MNKLNYKLVGYVFFYAIATILISVFPPGKEEMYYPVARYGSIYVHLLITLPVVVSIIVFCLKISKKVMISWPTIIICYIILSSMIVVAGYFFALATI